MKKAYGLSQDPFGVHQKIIKPVPGGSTVLEIGCASGYMAKELIKKNCQVYGIELDPTAANIAQKYCTQVVIGDIEDPTTFRKLKMKKFDIILLTDVLEHLKDPRQTLRKIKNYLAPSGIVLISTPNVAFLTVRLNLLLGRFDYTEYGIMDKTHLRFFTKKTLLELVQQAGLNVVRFESVGNFTQLPLYMQTLYPLVGKKRWWRVIEQKLTSWWPEGLAVQFLITCETGK